MDKLIKEASSCCIFQEPPVLPFKPTQTTCPQCHGTLKVLKSHAKTAVTMHIGAFITRETILHCDLCKTVYPCDGLNKLVPNHCTFGYDVMVHVGKALFLRHRNHREVMDELAEKNVHISASEIGYLGKKFIIYLAIAHRQCADKIKAQMQLKGGYILHLDATCEGKAPLLMTGLDSVTKIVLGNVKLPSEKAEKIIPFLRQLTNMFGRPVAVVHDMGRGILKAIEEVWPDIVNFICHFHFLRDIGKDLFGNEYAIIRNRLKKHGMTSKLRQHSRALKKVMDENPSLLDAFYSQLITPSQGPNFEVVATYSLIQWALEGKNQGQGYGFPFDQPQLVFAQRLHFLYVTIAPLMNESRCTNPLLKLLGDLEAVVKDTTLLRALTEIESKIKVFDKLRDAMRIAPKSGCQGLNCDGLDAQIQTIEKRVKKFYDWLSNRDKFSKDQNYQKMIVQLDKYWEKLFADPIIINTASGTIKIQPQRTNNILERFFRDFKRANRRKTGNNSMNRTLRAMLAETPLVKNLENRQYLDILLDGKSTLEEVFANIDSRSVREELQTANNPLDQVPAKIKKMIAKPIFPDLILNMLNC
jgi:hypothetical protein